MTSSASALPDDVDTLKATVVAMISEKADLQDETAELKAEIVRMATVNDRAETRIADLHAIIKRLERAQFGRSSEKLDVDQQAFAFDEVQTGLGAIEAELEAAKPASERPRNAFPAHLERVEIIIEPETVAALCACGNCMPVRIGEDVSERLDVTPAKFRVIVTRRPKYACSLCKEGVIQAPAPGHLVDSGVPSEALLAHVAVYKYADGLPLYRQEGIYARDGVEISRNSMAHWMGHVGFHLAPLADRILALIKEGERVYADETTLPTLSPGSGKTKTAWLWTYLWTASFLQVHFGDLTSYRLQLSIRSLVQLLLLTSMKSADRHPITIGPTGSVDPGLTGLPSHFNRPRIAETEQRRLSDRCAVTLPRSHDRPSDPSSLICQRDSCHVEMSPREQGL
ncbi:hypothetical protein ASE05_31775 [Mesorhizobium sp. Root172]|nr:hypothetical protein ASE05_31775 [Mesorhizobium sp. Root172]